MKTWLLPILLSLSVGGMPYDERPSGRVLSRLRSRCVEGQNLLHPRGGAYYMACTSGALRQRVCGVGRVFSVHARQCVNAQAGNHDSGTAQVLSSSNNNRLQHDPEYLSSRIPAGSEITGKRRRNSLVNENTIVNFRQTEKTQKIVHDTQAFIRDHRQRTLQETISRQKKIRASVGGRSDVSSLGCLRNLAFPVPKKVKPLRVTASLKKSAIVSEFRTSTSSARNNRRWSNGYTSPQDKRRKKLSWPLSHTQYPAQENENMSTATFLPGEVVRAQASTITSSSVFPSTSTAVNFKSTRKKISKATKVPSSTSVSLSKSSPSTLNTKSRGEDVISDAPLSHLSSDDLGNKSTHKHSVPEGSTAASNFLTQTGSSKETVQVSAAHRRTKVQISSVPATKKTFRSDTSDSVEALKMPLVSKAPAATLAALNVENSIPESTSCYANCGRFTNTLVTRDSVLRAHHSPRANTSEDSSKGVLISENTKNETTEKQLRHMKTSFTTVADDVMESTSLASSNGTIAPVQQTLRSQQGKLQGKRDQSSEATSGQGLLVLTELDDSGKAPLQASKTRKSEESVNDEILVRLLHPEPIRLTTESSVGVASEESSVEATHAEQVTGNPAEELPSTTDRVFPATESSISKTSKTSHELTILPQAPKSTFFTWETAKSAHSYYSGQTKPAGISISSAHQGVTTETTTPAATGHVSNQDTQVTSASTTTVAASAVFRRTKNAEVNKSIHSSVATNSRITLPQEITSTKEDKGYALAHIYNINNQYTESYSAMSTEDGTAFAAQYSATHDKMPYRGEYMKTTLPLFIEYISKTSLRPTASSGDVHMVVFTPPSPQLAAALPKHTIINSEGTSHPPSELEVNGGSAQRKNEAHVDKTAVIKNPQSAVTDFSKTSSEGHNGASGVFPWTEEKAALPALAPTPKAGSLLSSLAKSDTPMHSHTKAEVRMESDARHATILSTKGLSLAPVKHFLEGRGDGSQGGVVLYPRSTLLDSALSTPMSTTDLTFSSSLSNYDSNMIVTLQTANPDTSNVEVITGADRNTQNKPQPSQTEPEEQFKNDVNAAINTDSDNIGDVSPLYHPTEAYSLDNIEKEESKILTSNLIASASVTMKPLSDSNLNTAAQRSRSKNIPTSSLEFSEDYSHSLSLAHSQELTTIGNRNQLDTPPTYRATQSFMDSPITEGTHPFVSEWSDFNLLGPGGGTGTVPHNAHSNPTTESAYFTETSTQKPFTSGTTTHKTDAGGTFTAILQSFQKDIHHPSHSLTELHLSKSSGRSQILKPSITVHLSARYREKTSSETETATKISTATSEERITDRSAEPQFFPEKALTKGVKGATTSGRISLLKSARNTASEVNEETKAQESSTASQFTSPNSQEREDADHLKLTASSTNASASSPSPERTTHKGECTFSPKSENICNTMGDKAKIQVTTQRGEYAEKAVLGTPSPTTSEMTVTSAATTQTPQTWSTLQMAMLQKTTRAPLCKSTFGLFRHPTDCNLFVHCSNSVPFIKKCPANLHFNEKIMVCDWPYRAGCLSTVEK